MPAIPHADQEARTIARLYGTQPLIGGTATESAVREQAGTAVVLHVAAPGALRPREPPLSRIGPPSGRPGGGGTGGAQGDGRHPAKAGMVGRRNWERGVEGERG